MPTGETALTMWQVYSWCVVGIIVSIVLPILRNLLPKPPALSKADEGRGFAAVLWEQSRPFVVVGLFSLLTGLLIVAFTWGTLKDWRAALLAGYAWDSTLQKLTKA